MASFAHPLLAPEECAASALTINGPALRDILDDDPDGVDLVNIGWPVVPGPSSGANALSSSRAPSPLQVPVPGGSVASTPLTIDRARAHSPTVGFPRPNSIPLPDSPDMRRSPTVSPRQSPVLLPDVDTEPIPALSLTTTAEDSQVRKRGREGPEGSLADSAEDNPARQGNRAESERVDGDDEGPSKVTKRRKLVKSTRKKNASSSLLVTRPTRSSMSLSAPPLPTHVPAVSNSTSSSLVVSYTWTHLYPLATSSAPGAVLDLPHDSPKWLVRAVQLFDMNLGPKWIRAVELWYTREESFGFADHGRFPNKEKHRPDAIGQWQKYDRSSSWRPGRIEFKDYSKEFWDWWLAIQKKRRGNDGTCKAVRDETLFDKDAFNFYGALGMLQIMAALFFWGNAIVEDRKAGGRAGEDGSWVEELDDVFWVMERLYAE